MATRSRQLLSLEKEHQWLSNENCDSYKNLNLNKKGSTDTSFPSGSISIGYVKSDSNQGKVKMQYL